MRILLESVKNPRIVHEMLEKGKQEMVAERQQGKELMCWKRRIGRALTFQRWSTAGAGRPSQLNPDRDHQVVHSHVPLNRTQMKSSQVAAYENKQGKRGSNNRCKCKCKCKCRWKRSRECLQHLRISKKSPMSLILLVCSQMDRHRLRNWTFGAERISKVGFSPAVIN